jgi:hypothetical protein
MSFLALRPPTPMITLLAGAAFATVLAVLPSCGRTSEEEVRARFAAYVAGANQCQAASECTIAYGSCPVGCWVAVRADRKDDVERTAHELVAEYNRSGVACVYDCTTPGPVSCKAGRCFADVFGHIDPGSPDAGADAAP